MQAAAAPSAVRQCRVACSTRRTAPRPHKCCRRTVAMTRPVTTAAGSPSSAASAVADADACTPELIQLAHSLADAAAAVTSRYFRTPVPVDVKADASPVTIADKEAEAAIRQILAQQCPDHSIFGEEQGFAAGNSSSSSSDYLWVIDPIDGTKSFITGKPLFGTLIALLYKGTPVLGIIDQPILKERWLGVVGRPSTLNGHPITTRQCTDISSAYLYATTPHMFAGATEEAFNRVRDAVRIPMYGCDCYAYGLLAAGYCDLVVEADLKPYDYMALVPIIEGAGGRVTDWRGCPLTWHVASQDDAATYSGEVVAAGDARTHQQAIDLLRWQQ